MSFSKALCGPNGVAARMGMKCGVGVTAPPRPARPIMRPLQPVRLTSWPGRPVPAAVPARPQPSVKQPARPAKPARQPANAKQPAKQPVRQPPVRKQPAKPAAAPARPAAAPAAKPPAGGGTALERGPVKIPIKRGSGAGSFKNKPSPKYANIPKTGAIVTFEVMFDPGYEWGCKGKVGGLSVGTGKSSGCNYSEDGASLRMMWDGDQGDVATPYAYVYVPTGTARKQPPGLQDPPRCGQDLYKFDPDFKGKMRSGVWYTISLGVKLNTQGERTGPGVEDYRLHYDGQLLFSFEGKEKILNGVCWRKTGETIQQLHFNVFHGGPCKAQEDSSMQIRNVSVRPW